MKDAELIKEQQYLAFEEKNKDIKIGIRKLKLTTSKSEKPSKNTETERLLNSLEIRLIELVISS